MLAGAASLASSILYAQSYGKFGVKEDTTIQSLTARQFELRALRLYEHIRR